MSTEKVVITIETALLSQIRERVRLRRAPSVSAYISRALEARLSSDAIARLVEDLRRDRGQPSRAAKTWARAVLRKSHAR